VKNVREIMDEYGSRLDEFKSPLSKDWETVLFKAIDILHNLQNEGLAETIRIKQKLLPLIETEACDKNVLDEAIQETQTLFDDCDDKFVQKIFREVLDLLFAVKINFNSKDNIK